MAIKDLLKERRLELSLTMLDVAKMVGVSEGTISRWESGDIKNMRRDKIVLLAKALQTSPAKIMGWEESEPQLPKDAVPYNPVVHEIPILGTIAAGQPLYAEQHIEGYTYTDRNGGAEYFALRVKGDSMNAINICDGSVITVRRQSEVENGEIAVVMVNNDNATVKRFKREDAMVQLIPQSYNPEHQIQIYDLKKDKIDIVGKVMECKIEF